MAEAQNSASSGIELASPAKIIDTLVVVPFDSQRIDTRPILEGATGSGNADATLQFTMDPQNGNAIFDLGQTIAANWLDGVALAVTKLGSVPVQISASWPGVGLVDGATFDLTDSLNDGEDPAVWGSLDDFSQLVKRAVGAIEPSNLL